MSQWISKFSRPSTGFATRDTYDTVTLIKALGWGLFEPISRTYVCASVRSNFVEALCCNRPLCNGSFCDGLLCDGSFCNGFVCDESFCNRSLCDEFDLDGRLLGPCLDWKRGFRLPLPTVKPGLPGRPSWVLRKNRCSHSAVVPRRRNDPKHDRSLYSHQNWCIQM